ncbi:ATPase [hydrothermal vent metagenome]|uniref:ATPase n=1 Tax=hydrothermal vent metagenome TaxID=652676 RepID=A0A3B0RQB2_9ZZZZ
MGTVIETWRKLVTDDQLQFDPSQERAAQMLTLLAGRLHNWKPGKKTMLFGRAEPSPKGLYLYGDVGIGKSMLMHMFFTSAPVARKTRVHFHDFMQQAHRDIAQWRSFTPQQRRQHANYVKGAGDDPIAPVAKGIAAIADLICFDEFQVTDIANAMLLGRLFDKLFAAGVVMVATSNRAPQELYQDGLNRQLFLPFIDLLGQQLDILELVGVRDYRQDKLASKPAYFTPLGSASDAGLDELWQNLLAGAKPYARKIYVQGRELSFANTFGGAVRTSFAELCEPALGSADYLELAAQFHTVFVEQIPKMTADKRNEAKRFVLLIDALYEARVKLVVSAATQPEQLYDTGDGSFEFARCASRLMEMRSDNWRDMAHSGQGLVI